MAERDDIPLATAVPRKSTRISVVWIIPILAAVVAIGIAVQSILSQGPTITIVLKEAQGIEAGKTLIKYKDVNIGQVTKVQLADGHKRVEVRAKIDKSATDLMVEDAKFWVVEPRVTLSGISGIGTLLSGNYIGFEAGKSDKPRRTFTALEVPPVVTGGQPGKEFSLRADNLSSLGIGSPVYYRRLQAGQIIAYDLARDGKAIDLKIFVNAPYDKYVNSSTVFWNASGVDVSVGAGGLEVHTESLVAVIAGGIAFETPSWASAAEPAAANTTFTLHGDKGVAIKQPDVVSQHYVLYFNETLRGLSKGAPVTLLGLPGGEVVEVGLDLDPATASIRGRVEIVTFPERLIARLNRQQAGLGDAFAKSQQQRRALMEQLVERRGLRAQLQSGNLLTGQLFVALDYFPDAPKAKIDWSGEVPVFPVVASTLPDLEAKLSSIVAKLDKLPLEAIGNDAKKVLESLDQTLQSADKLVKNFDGKVLPELDTTLADLRRSLAAATSVLKSTDANLLGKDAPGQQELRDTLQEVTRAAQSIRILADYLERHPESLLRGKTEEKP
jgi:paraquat-inducible protein B